MAETRSADIAAALRRRIVAGELPPGARMPSTRALVQRYGVAMATATKVLTTLRQEGLIRSVPGVGTLVVGDQPPRPPARLPGQKGATEGGLAAESIVAAGIAVADSEGLAAVSMRRLAAELGAAPMSLYRHVTDKDDLLLQMMDRAIGDVPLPERPPAEWRTAAELAARTMWSAFRRHPWLAPALSLSRPQPLANAIAYGEWLLAGLGSLPVEPAQRFMVHLTLFTFVRGTAMNLELEAEAEAASGQNADEWMARTEPDLQALVAGGQFPRFAEIAAGDFRLDLDVVFEFGLGRFLDGVASMAPRR